MAKENNFKEGSSCSKGDRSCFGAGFWKIEKNWPKEQEVKRSVVNVGVCEKL